MRINPRNRRIVLEKTSLLEEEESKQANKLKEFLASEKTKEQKDILFKIISVSPDCTLSVSVGDIVFVEEHMIEEKMVSGQKVLLIQENYIQGVVYAQ